MLSSAISTGSASGKSDIILWTSSQFAFVHFKKVRTVKLDTTLRRPGAILSKFIWLKRMRVGKRCSSCLWFQRIYHTMCCVNNHEGDFRCSTTAGHRTFHLPTSNACRKLSYTCYRKADYERLCYHAYCTWYRPRQQHCTLLMTAPKAFFFSNQNFLLCYFCCDRSLLISRY